LLDSGNDTDRLSSGVKPRAAATQRSGRSHPNSGADRHGREVGTLRTTLILSRRRHTSWPGSGSSQARQGLCPSDNSRCARSLAFTSLANVAPTWFFYEPTVLAGRPDPATDASSAIASSACASRLSLSPLPIPRRPKHASRWLCGYGYTVRDKNNEKGPDAIWVQFAYRR